MDRIKTEDGDWCAIREMKYCKPQHKQLCINCGKVLKEGDAIALLINNYTIFPNCIIHIKCMDKFNTREDCISILKDRYEDSKQMMKEARELWPAVHE